MVVILNLLLYSKEYATDYLLHNIQSSVSFSAIHASCVVQFLFTQSILRETFSAQTKFDNFLLCLFFEKRCWKDNYVQVSIFRESDFHKFSKKYCSYSFLPVYSLLFKKHGKHAKYLKKWRILNFFINFPKYVNGLN